MREDSNAENISADDKMELLEPQRPPLWVSEGVLSSWLQASLLAQLEDCHVPGLPTTHKYVWVFLRFWQTSLRGIRIWEHSLGCVINLPPPPRRWFTSGKLAIWICSLLGNPTLYPCVWACSVSLTETLQNIKAQSYTWNSKWAASSYLFLLNDIKSGNCLKNVWHLPKIFLVEQLNYMVTKVHMGQRMGLWEERFHVSRWKMILMFGVTQGAIGDSVSNPFGYFNQKLKSIVKENPWLFKWSFGFMTLWTLKDNANITESNKSKFQDLTLTNALLFWFSWVADATWMIFRFINKYKETD